MSSHCNLHGNNPKFCHAFRAYQCYLHRLDDVEDEEHRLRLITYGNAEQERAKLNRQPYYDAKIFDSTSISSTSTSSKSQSHSHSGDQGRCRYTRWSTPSPDIDPIYQYPFFLGTCRSWRRSRTDTTSNTTRNTTKNTTNTIKNTTNNTTTRNTTRNDTKNSTKNNTRNTARRLLEMRFNIEYGEQLRLESIQLKRARRAEKARREEREMVEKIETFEKEKKEKERKNKKREEMEKKERDKKEMERNVKQIKEIMLARREVGEEQEKERLEKFVRDWGWLGWVWVLFLRTFLGRSPVVTGVMG